MLLEECAWICGSKQNVEFNFLPNFCTFLRDFMILTASQEIESNQTM